MKALILAAGKGKRIKEISQDINKCMIKIGDKPLIEYSLVRALYPEISEIVIIVGYRAEDIIGVYGNNYQGKPLKYAFQSEQRGLVHAIECAKEALGKEDFMLMLGDEVMVDPKNKEMIKEYLASKPFGVCGTMAVEDLSMISHNYSVGQKEGIIYEVIEKPENPKTNIMGTGNCIFDNEIFSFIAKTPVNLKRGEKELPGLIQTAINEGKIFKSFPVCSGYINVNYGEDFQAAGWKLFNKIKPKK